MAWIYLAASEVSDSRSNPGSEPSPIVRQTDTLKQSFCPGCGAATWIEPQYGTTFAPCAETCSHPSTSSSAAFLARISVLRDLEQVWRGAEAGLYLNCSGSLANADLDSFSWKTSQLSLFGGLTDFSWNSMRWGMMRGGQLFQPSRWEPRTSGDESGLFQTPLASDGEKMGWRSTAAGPVYGLSAAAARGLLPTPTASEGGTNQSASEGSAIRASLGYLARTETLPTPRARDWKGGGKDCLDSAVGGQLNPQFVEAIMGYPIGWTELNALVTPWFRTRRGKRSKD
jgi:hypothetical protein